MDTTEAYTEETIWSALDERGFDPAYQEVMVTQAAMSGEHWSFRGGTDSDKHVHITSDGNGTYELRDAGRECKHL